VTRKSDPHGPRERPPVPIDVHDHAAQTFFAISVLARAGLAKLPPRLAHGELARCLGEVADLAMAASRRLLQERLAPGAHVTDSLSAAAALRGWVYGFQQRTGIDVGVVVAGPIVSLPDEVVDIVQLAATEVLSKIERHPEARAVVVSLRTGRRGVTLIVQDDGPDRRADDRADFDIEEVSTRAHRIGGAIVSTRREGVNMVRVRLPVSRAVSATGRHGSPPAALCAC
jgi:signal transduction histidine kinase